MERTGSGSDLQLMNGQDFYSLRANCLQQGNLFQDPYFKKDPQYKWMRPYDLVSDPKLYVGGISRFDIVQGQLGDCWMLASIAAIACQPQLVRNVVPQDQSFSTGQYAGIFHFHFWRYGVWYDVVIDDLLPTKWGALVYTKSTAANEFWTALLEKAYCKCLGGYYKVANAGNLCEALEDFTGGVVEQFYIPGAPKNFPDIMFLSVKRHSLVGTYIDGVPGEPEFVNGVAKNHSYTVTDCREIDVPGHGKIELIRLRNPWGNFEWKGAWSDGSPEWNSVPDSTKKQLGLVVRDDGEFWMDFSDYTKIYEWVDMCHLSPGAFMDAYGDDESVKAWSLQTIRGNWVSGVSAGGAKYLYMNPQIKLQLTAAEDDNNDGLISVLIALMQMASGCSATLFEIGFLVYNMDPNMQYLDKNFFDNNAPIGSVPSRAVREVAGRFNLQPGTYCIVPFTYEYNKERGYMVRIYSETNSSMNEMDTKIGLSPDNVLNEITPPMSHIVGDAGDFVDKKELKLHFEKVAGLDKQVDWKELQTILNNTMKSSVPKQVKHHGFFGKVKEAVESVFSTNNSDKPEKNNAFSSVGEEGFSNDLCRSLVAMMDVDHSGKLDFNEFYDLWREVEKWKTVYERFSEEEDGMLTTNGLKEALIASGYNFNKKIFANLVHRYSTKGGKVPFDDFLQCVIMVKTMTAFFKSKDKGKSNKAEFTLEEFMRKVLYC